MSSFCDKILKTEGGSTWKKIQCEIKLKKLKEKLEKIKDDIKIVEDTIDHYKFMEDHFKVLI